MITAAISCGQINYPVFIHENIIDDVARAPTLRRRLSLTLQHLASMGRTSVVKGCSPPNRGWRRTPMGGSGRMAQYLLWTHGGSQIIPRDGFVQNSDTSQNIRILRGKENRSEA